MNHSTQVFRPKGLDVYRGYSGGSVSTPDVRGKLWATCDSINNPPTGYPREFFLRVARTISFGDRTDLLTPHPRRTLPPSTTLFRVRHHPALPSSVIWEQLKDEDLPFDPMIVALKPKSHRDHLVHAKTPGRDKTLSSLPPPSSSTPHPGGTPAAGTSALPTSFNNQHND